METTVLLLCLIYVFAIVYASNGRKHPITNQRLFLVLGIGGIIACLIHTAAIYNKVGETEFFPTLFVYLIFIGVCSVTYGVLLKENTDKKKKGLAKEGDSAMLSEQDGGDLMKGREELRPYNLKEVKKYMDNDFQELEQDKRKALKWGLEELQIIGVR